MKTSLIFAATLFLCFESFAQTISHPSDFFPLNAGRKWSYAYNSLEKTYLDIATQSTQTKDSGFVQYTITGFTSTDTSRVWNIQERDSIVRIIHNYQSGSDSTVIITASPALQFTELLDSLHTLRSSSNFPPFTFPVNWGMRSDSSIFRYGLDSTYRFITEYQDIAGSTWNYYDTLSFQRGVGLINARSLTVKGPNTPYYLRWEANMTSTLADIPASGKTNPCSYLLLQNYPNPFNPSTNISFSLSTKSYVSLEIFDVLGRRVDKLINRYIESGSHRVTWNASNNASGIYFCKLSAGNNAQTIKLILLR